MTTTGIGSVFSGMGCVVNDTNDDLIVVIDHVYYKLPPGGQTQEDGDHKVDCDGAWVNGTFYKVGDNSTMTVSESASGTDHPDDDGESYADVNAAVGLTEEEQCRYGTQDPPSHTGDIPSLVPDGGNTFGNQDYKKP